MSDRHATPIKGLYLRLVKTIADERGFLAELFSGVNEENFFFSKGIKHILAVVAKTKGVPRGGHYHKTSYENSWVVGGTGIWYFYDFNPSSPSFQKSAAFLVGEKSMLIPRELQIADYTLETKGSICQIFVSPYIYHLIIPLEVPLTFFETATHVYDETDYVRIKPQDIDDALLKKITDFPL